MKYKVNDVRQMKPLADFYNGECFMAYVGGDAHLFMTIDIGASDRQSPHTNIRYALDFDEAKVVAFPDYVECEPLEVTIDIKDE